ncbi:SH3 domain-containing protein [Candidatus Parcubacteria bacterium]|nr:SH3 domain-containing protein [Patescibacteria group bacterium]MBU4082942.1 SH3 domain-containing protein [Patescibacteria group bacterium]MCG2687969.1 SH3 domain-containing protein [Candidatus Parcubacteria bacterium]
MKKIVITILALLIAPMTVGAVADQMIFDANTNIEVGGVTLVIQDESIVDDMVVGANNIVFSLSTNSTLTIRSYDRKILNTTGDILAVSCNNTYSEISATGAPVASLTVTPSSEVCASTDPPSGGSGGGGGVAVPATPTTPTTTTGAVTATAGGGGKTTLTTDQNATAAVSLPIGAVSVSTNILITAESEGTVTASRPTPSSRSVVGGYIYDFTATSGTQAITNFNQTLTLTFTYTDEQISGLNESNLRVFYWKESTSQWVALVTTVNAETNTLTAETDHFTYFAVMGLTEGTEDEEELVEEAPTTIIDGDLIRNPNASGMAQFDIYIVKLANGKMFKRLILSPHVFESYEHFDKNGNGSPWDDVKDVAQSVMNEYTVSDLVRAVGDSKVYQLIASGDTGTKRWMNMTAARFANRGHDSDSIYEINETDRNAYATGADITEGEVSSSETIIIKVSTLRVRNLPSTEGEILTNVSEGEVYDLLDEQNGWYKITVNSVTGWCYGGDTGGYAAKQ